MITQTMTPHEIVREAKADFDSIWNNSMERLVRKYNRERTTKKVPKEENHVCCYPIKSAKKNPWLIYLKKKQYDKKYRGLPGIYGVTYYYSKWGLRALEVNYDAVNAYNGHLFSRYNERLGLSIVQPIDRIKRFFTIGHMRVSKNKPKDKFGRVLNVLPTSEGFALGEEQENGLWVVYKTFISNKMMHHPQREILHEVLKYIKREASQEKNDPQSSKEEYEWLSNALENMDQASLLTDLLIPVRL